MMSPDEATVDVAVQIYLDGAMSGIATMLVNASNPPPTEMVDAIAQSIVDRVRRDPDTRAAIRGEVIERFLGVDTGPKSFTLPGEAKP